MPTVRAGTRAVTIFEKATGPESPETAQALSGLGTALEGAGKYAEAEAVFRRVVAIAEKVRGTEHVDTAATLLDLGRIMEDQGKFKEAENIYIRARNIFSEQLGAGNEYSRDIDAAIQNVKDTAEWE